MADQQALINALQNLVAAMAANNNNIPAPTAHVPILDPFNATSKNLLQDYHSITPAMTEAARVARADPRAIQNLLALYTCVKNSIEGTLQTTMFDQGGNLLETQDGCSLLIHLLGFTTASLLQLSIDSLRRASRLLILLHSTST
jgi:hypothetical protein